MALYRHSVDSAAENKIVNEVVNNSFDEANDDKKKKKNSMRPLPEMDRRPSQSRFETNYNGLENELPAMESYQQEGISECPLLDAMETRCRGIDLLSGDMHQELLPVCGVHQLCYLCVRNYLVGFVFVIVVRCYHIFSLGSITIGARCLGIDSDTQSDFSVVN